MDPNEKKPQDAEANETPKTVEHPEAKKVVEHASRADENVSAEEAARDVGHAAQDAWKDVGSWEDGESA